MKHAYLIIAHHEFEVLQKLIEALDDERNDIYLHIDKKVSQLPHVAAQKAKIFFVADRIDVRWGHISQIECEYALFEMAYYSPEKYTRFHLLSGTHLPLKNQDEIHACFADYEGKEVLSLLYTNGYEINMKLERYHFLLRYFRYGRPWLQKSANFLWHILLKLQYIFHIQKRKLNVTLKANNWVSLTPAAVAFILKRKTEVNQRFKWSLCGDEFFVPYLLEQDKKSFTLVGVEHMLYNEFIGSNPRTLTSDDLDFLLQSDYLFARKFSSTDLQVVDRILKHIGVAL
ncbi:glycosyl transferase [Sphingobacterium alkalisoli]|uniref:Peptide O-xylosyltransferase n=1 Tax=Sphingobacterium alkalisoli TaxID=1874115 RepID=A0A4U0GN42_9SPHI|nr:beta-1,6-N-acetylglucosaminyltransferase [Sphingobacterium alkalisoli]TJY60137.1 glycosyl transferase [Sphingobacterium alkalisoli]GGH32148.1 glycosyl transferase [Sphingobacterium alkalisoli]